MNAITTHDRRLLFLGDSITDCGRREDPDGLGHGYVRLLSEHLVGEDAPSSLVNRGISGHRARDLRARFDEDVLAEEPDLLTLYVGVNDTWRRYDQDDPTDDEEFAADVEAMLGTFRSARPDADVVIMLPFVADVDEDKARYHEDLDGKVAQLRRLAQQHGALVVDLERTLREALESGISPEEFALDGVHPSPFGHRLLAAAWMAAVRGQ